MSNTRYTISRDRMADLRGGSDSTDAFGPTRTTGETTSSQRNQTSSYESRPSTYEMQERQTSQNVVASAAHTDILTTDGYLAEVGEISSCIKVIHQNIDLISELHDSSLISINEQQWKKNSSQLSQFVNETSSMNTNIKNRIKALESSNAKHPNNSDLKIRRAQAARVKKEFISCIQRYKDVEGSFNQKFRQRVARQIRIVKQDVTEEELDAIIDSDQQNQIFAQSLMQNSRTGQAKAVLSEVQTRHDDIKRIQKTILELAQLFEDMQMMVEEQGETLDQVEHHAETVAVDIEKGGSHINRAIIIAKSTRAKKWCCLFITIILAVVIAILVWWFAFGHPGVGGGSGDNEPQQ
ncbi:t-SNARE [Helicostylum pulchrum]|uniref:t-SNARE coiled-coil homology domain-containing protein n=1 Tax=Helicostylum pulchrum TaxID=562976 RepID=A0ABP9YFE1_9FUNG|nr:t-SNARE [Helicostylum pulchrum]